MMSQTNAEKSPNTIPLSHVIDIRINQEYLGTTESKDLLRGWEKWSLKDIIPIFNSSNGGSVFQQVDISEKSFF